MGGHGARIKVYGVLFAAEGLLRVGQEGGSFMSSP